MNFDNTSRGLCHAQVPTSCNFSRLQHVERSKSKTPESLPSAVSIEYMRSTTLLDWQMRAAFRYARWSRQRKPESRAGQDLEMRNNHRAINETNVEENVFSPSNPTPQDAYEI